MLRQGLLDPLQQGWPGSQYRSPSSVVSLASSCYYLLWLPIFSYRAFTDITSVSQNILIISLCTYWSMIEMGLSIVAACLPTLRPLFSNPSPPGWCRHLKSRTILSSKTSFPFSMRSKRSSDSDTTDSNDLPKQHGGLSSSSQNSIPPAKIRPLAISVYAMNDVEAQTDSPSWKSTVRDQIEHESLKQ